MSIYTCMFISIFTSIYIFVYMYIFREICILTGSYRVDGARELGSEGLARRGRQLLARVVVQTLFVKSFKVASLKRYNLYRTCDFGPST